MTIYVIRSIIQVTTLNNQEHIAYIFFAFSKVLRLYLYYTQNFTYVNTLYAKFYV
nr:MAG TPA: hypothetical protein [Caudoviricetes sp.]